MEGSLDSRKSPNVNERIKNQIGRLEDAGNLRGEILNIVRDAIYEAVQKSGYNTNLQYDMREFGAEALSNYTDNDDIAALTKVAEEAGLNLLKQITMPEQKMSEIIDAYQEVLHRMLDVYYEKKKINVRDIGKMDLKN